MSFGVIVAILPLVLAVIGVLATLIAPKISKNASVFVEVPTTIEMSRRMEDLPDDFNFVYKDAKIDDAVSLGEINICNVGELDIAGNSFIEPIKISVPDGFKLLSVSEDGQNPAGLNITDTSENGFLITWSLLKKKEVVKLVAIFSHDAEIQLEDKTNEFEFNIRLQDVRTASRKKPMAAYLANRFMVFLLVFIVFSLLFLSSFWVEKNAVWSYVGRPHFVNTKSINFDDSVVKVCEVFDKLQIGENCKEVSLSEISAVDPIQFERSYMSGVPLYSFLIVLILSIFYTMLLFSTKLARAMVRRVSKRLRKKQP